MIVVTRLNDTRFAVNPDLIERVQESPDTTLTLVGGTSYVVRESMEQVIEMIMKFRAGVIAHARALPAVSGPGAGVLEVVPFPAREQRTASAPARKR
jgi:flagellar protein FlbD